MHEIHGSDMSSSVTVFTFLNNEIMCLLYAEEKRCYLIVILISITMRV